MSINDAKALIDHSENALCEQPSIDLFAELEWQTANCFREFDHGLSSLGRSSKGEVVLVSKLRAALEKLNPDLPREAIGLAIDEITRDRSLMSLANANRDVYRLLKDGVKVSFRGGEDGDEEVVETVRVIDWQEPTNNDFFLASQFWIAGEMHVRRPDLIGFVNGLPLVFIELKAPERSVKDAYDDNLRDYRDTIPQLFWFNGLVILSNGKDSKLGSITSKWEHFCDWKRINSEGEKGVVSLETIIRGTCDKTRLLDLIENFTLFPEVKGGLIKVVGKNHQFLGVNNALQAVRDIKQNQGKLGVFWHTQGSGKSISMIFFAQKILRTLPGNWTFVVITDRLELDDQIYKNFTSAGVVTEEECQATNGEDLKRLLTEDHRYVFTLIQKFRGERFTDPKAGAVKKYPKLSDRSDIIVITDEAHRSQYDSLARNMRDALPNAAFIAFTGTPLIAGEERTKDVFGDYVSIYNFRQSVEDGATVPLYYENRIPELQLANEFFKDEMEAIIDDALAEIDDAEKQAAFEKKLEQEFAREYQLITRAERLDAVAADLVEHFLGRGFRGKAMMVCIDKATAVRMYDKVQAQWKAGIAEREQRLTKLSGAAADQLREELAYMKATDMAVVVSQAQNEVDDMKAKGLDIKPHRKRMVEEDMEGKFKDENDPFRLVFVCAMWMTGFDVPHCSTIYMDKPLRNHTLMQTIARANRVFPDKECGTIVDYVGVFKNLNKALALYGDPTGRSKGGGKTGDDGKHPANPKTELLERLREAIADTAAFCTEKGFDVRKIPEAQGFERVALLADAVEKLVINDETKKTFRTLAGTVARLYKASLPEDTAASLAPVCVAIAAIAKDSTLQPPEVDISKVLGQVEDLLDRSIAAEGYVIDADRAKHLLDLSEVDFEALKKAFDKSLKRTEAQKLRTAVESKLLKMVRENKTRMDYLEKFQQLIDSYNSGSVNVEEFFRRLCDFAKSLNDEDKRGLAEGLTNEELAIFDLLTKPGIQLAPKELKNVKAMARTLLEKLKADKLVLDWKKQQRTQAAVRSCIEEVLDGLPESCYPAELYQLKCEQAFQHVFENYSEAGRNTYTAV